MTTFATTHTHGVLHGYMALSACRSPHPYHLSAVIFFTSKNTLTLWQAKNSLSACGRCWPTVADCKRLVIYWLQPTGWHRLASCVPLSVCGSVYIPLHMPVAVCSVLAPIAVCQSWFNGYNLLAKDAPFSGLVAWNFMKKKNFSVRTSTANPVYPVCRFVSLHMAKSDERRVSKRKTVKF